jgi:hypothetical protein
MSGAVRAKRWPESATIRDATAALERGDTLALQSRKLRYVTEFFGIVLPMVDASQTPRQRAARLNWTRRREELGPTGFSEQGHHALRLNLVQAQTVKRRKPKATHCGRGHKWTSDNTRMTSKGRTCRACEVLVRHEKIEKRRAWLARKEQVEAARAYMLEVGVRSDQNPTSAYWRDRYVAARARWQKLKQQAA